MAEMKPEPGEAKFAEDILDAIQKILHKREACLIFKIKSMILGRAKLGDTKWTVVHQGRLLTETRCEPVAGNDFSRDLTAELQVCLAIHHAALIHKPDCIVLAVNIEPGKNRWKAIAQVRSIRGQIGQMKASIDWRPVEWVSEGITIQ